MTYSSKLPPKEYAKLRTQPELIRQEYERKANQALREMVAKEQENFQKQLNEYQEYAQGEIDKAWKEAEHWKIQTEIIFGLMQESEKLIEGEREAHGREVEVLRRRIEKLEMEKRNRMKAKRVIGRD